MDMESIFEIAFFATLAAIATLVWAVLAMFFGGVGGWIAGWFFHDTFIVMRQFLHLENATPFELGAMFGFIGSFFRSSVRSSD